MEYWFLVGRILYGEFFVLVGINHLSNSAMMTGYTASKGVPAPRVAVLGSGILVLLGGLSMVTGFHPVTGVVLLSVFLVPATLIMHNFWADADPNTRMNDMIHFQKNVALVGAAWMFLLVPRPWLFSLG